MFSIKAFQDEEVVELPEQNKRKRHIPELVDVDAPALALKPIGPGGPCDAGGGGSVPADLALVAQLGKWHPAAEVGEYAAKARSAALG